MLCVPITEKKHDILPSIRNPRSLKKLNIPNVSCEIPFLNIPNESYKLSKTQHLPNSIQLSSNEPIVTFQLYCGILWGVNLNIQTVLWNFDTDGSSKESLQNVQLWRKK
jgi:hypothetical protein